MLRRTFLKFLGVTPSTPILGHLLPKEVAKKFRIIHMGEIMDEHSGTWPFRKGQTAELGEPPKEWANYNADWLVWLKGPEGKSYCVNKSLIRLFDRKEEIR